MANKGFYHLKNVELLRKECLRFVLPLKRDNHLIDSSLITKTPSNQAGRLSISSLRVLEGTFSV